ncbi:MAG: fatty acid desaturase [Bacteroidales bacterium]|nr:fatty acid desaturase [Bacteroidales bacterium]
MGRHNTDQDWIEVVKKYNTPDIRKSIWQLINSFIPYVIIWYLMYLSLDISYWLTLGLSVFAAAFLVRLFIIFHDCGHGSFFRSKKLNRVVGTIIGTLVFTPYDRWHSTHAVHHATVGNLDKRGVGDVWTLTVEEYKNLPKWKKTAYRVYRNPVVLFLIGPFFLFVLSFRFTKKSMNTKERQSVYLSNILMLFYVTGLILLMGWKSFLMIQLPITYISTTAGVWLFYVQHQYPDVVWSRKEEWDYKKMALEGSSYLKLPRVLQWFSGNIGFHHIHHLSPKIPNYNLQRCHTENEMFSNIKPVTFVPSMRTMSLKLWDEQRKKLISFRKLRRSLKPNNI